jgi:iron complex outermembrane recepter protein
MAMADSAQFNIPAQPLPIALKAFATQAHMQLLYQYDAVKSAKGNPVSGDIEKHVALTQLLRNTGLEAVYSSDSAAAIRRVRDSSSQPTGQTQQNRPTLLVQEQEPATTQANPAAPPPAAADASGDAAEQAATGDLTTVVVTGSRAVRNGNQAPTPVTVLSADQLLQSQPTLVVDALAEIPALSNSTTRTSVGGSTAMGPGSFLNLFDLGANRTLVLLDGRRVTPSTNQGTVDVTMIPSLLLQRVDVVTGGASAAYGSDAVSGVVNFVLDNNFTGIKGEISGGESTIGDVPTTNVAFAYGGRFADNRLHVVAAVQNFTSGGLGGPDGADGRGYLGSLGGLIPNPSVTATNPASATNPLYLLEKNVTYPYATFGGLIVGGPLGGTQFGPGGVPGKIQPGTLATANAQVGGGGAYFSPYINYVSPEQVFDGYGKVTFDITPETQAYVQALYGRNHSTYVQDPPFQTQGTDYTIYAGNPFIPASVAAAMQQNGVASFKLGRVDTDWPFITADNGYQTYDVTAGIQGAIGNWNYDTYAEHGDSRFFLYMHNEPNVSNVYNAADAVLNPANGQIVCRSTLTNPTNGCVPLNLFGPGAASAAALAYVQGTLMTNQELQQDVASFNMNGSPFATWAAPVSIGFGAEYRNEFGSSTVDPISSSPIATAGIRGLPAADIVAPIGGWQTNNPQPLNGSYHIEEGYLEALVPLLRNVFLAKSLDLNIAGRLTSYSTSGLVKTWKAGLSYEPFADLRLRATKSRDIRAPDLQDLYAGNAQSYVTITDPQNNNAQVVNVTQERRGNPALTPEVADTETFGVVYQPSWFGGFSGSVDYFDIKIKNAISQLSSQNEVTLCADGETSLCSQIERQNGQILEISTPTLNLASAHAEGMDLEFGYRHNLSDIVSGLPGALSARAIGTYLGVQSTSSPTATGIVTIENAGDIGQSAQPKWRWYTSLGYELDRLSVTVIGRYIGSGKYDNQYTDVQLADNANYVPSIFYVDSTIQYKLGFGGGDSSVFLSFNNLFNRDAPIVPANNFNASQTPLGLYDVVGRSFVLGVRFKF